MNELKRIEEQREAVLAQMERMRCMRQGSVNEQWFAVVRNGKPTQEKRGPYYVLTAKQNGRTVSQRLRSPQQVARTKEEVANHSRFMDLCRQFAQLTEQMGELERPEAGQAAQEKKRRKSLSNRTGK
jgi:hypothetical protein